MVTAERPIRGGDLLHLTRAASVQFVRPIVVRVIRHLADRPAYDGWAWIEAYELDARGEAVAKRELFVWRAGLRWLATPPVPAARRPVRGAHDARTPGSRERGSPMPGSQRGWQVPAMRFREHLPSRPTWRCRACGIAWPCSPAKLRLLGEFRGDRAALALRLAALQAEAVEQLAQLDGGTPTVDLADRFVGWVHPRG
ncbi:hypothetical protein [Micromonospora cathayae]|uniref:hypothetical protein n=1 Tax=Micromonospora cathayae TaxID=3028804 RepID=UPI003C6CFB13